MAESKREEIIDYAQLMMYLPEKINKCITLLADEYLKDSSLKAFYVPYLVHINAADGISQKELKALIPFDKSRISVVVHELIDKGLIYDDGVGRNSSLHLTEEGRAHFALCKEFNDVVRKDIFGLDDDIEAEIRAKVKAFDDRLNAVVEKYSKS